MLPAFGDDGLISRTSLEIITLLTMRENLTEDGKRIVEMVLGNELIIDYSFNKLLNPLITIQVQEEVLTQFNG